jgi:hypothetical protein
MPKAMGSNDRIRWAMALAVMLLLGWAGLTLRQGGMDNISRLKDMGECYMRPDCGRSIMPLHSQETIDGLWAQVECAAQTDSSWMAILPFHHADSQAVAFRNLLRLMWVLYSHSTVAAAGEDGAIALHGHTFVSGDTPLLLRVREREGHLIITDAEGLCAFLRKTSEAWLRHVTLNGERP